MLIFIDKSTGTWGAAEDICWVEIDNPIDTLEDMTDNEIMSYGYEHGMTPLLPLF